MKNDLTFGISEKSFFYLITALKNFPEVEKAVIFGSRAIGNAKAGSDIDIAVFGNELNTDIVRELKILLNEKYNIPYFIDVVEYNSISNAELKKHIIENGKIIFIKQIKKVKGQITPLQRKAKV
ncbi:MAG: nucleotidyltransferase domain-containing protein [Ignavibacteriae bacterium]|nr:nucleotidyltransferase domain-containing protein [Ignavibacteriota bacterium]